MGGLKDKFDCLNCGWHLECAIIYEEAGSDFRCPKQMMSNDRGSANKRSSIKKGGCRSLDDKQQLLKKGENIK